MTETELLAALKLAAKHMACGEYDNREAFRTAVDQVYGVLKKCEHKESK